MKYFFGTKVIRQTKAISFNGTSAHIYDLDSNEITDLGKFLKKHCSVVPSSCKLTIHI